MLVRALQTAIAGGTYPKVVSSVDIPLDHVAIVLGKVGIEAVLGGNVATLLITGLLVLLVVTMGGIELAGAVSETGLAAIGADSNGQLTRLPNFPI
jgi:hypothetical protein